MNISLVLDRNSTWSTKFINYYEWKSIEISGH